MHINGKKVVPIPNNTNPLEKVIEKKVKDYAKSKGYYVRKFNSEGMRSVPDAIFITPNGWVFFIEFKRLGKKPTTAQLLEHKAIENNEIQVFIVDNIAYGKELIDHAYRHTDMNDV